MEYGHTGNFLLYVGVTGVYRNTVPPVIALSVHSSTTEDVDHEAQFWINRVASFIVFSAFGSGHWRTVAQGREIAVRQELNVHFEFYL